MLWAPAAKAYCYELAKINAQRVSINNVAHLTPDRFLSTRIQCQCIFNGILLLVG